MADLIGKLLEGEAFRDAIHIAIAPVVAVEKLAPGEDIGFVDGGTVNVGGNAEVKLGIVDPFLKKRIMAGDKFFMFLYPNTITSLRHDWLHPAFNKQESDKAKSEAWLRNFAEELDMGYAAMMEAIRMADEEGEWHTFHYDTPEAVYRDKDAMWRHYEIVTGKKVLDKDVTVFSCAC